MKGAKLYIKHKLTELIIKFEDSNYTIQAIYLNRLYIHNKRQPIQTNFREIKMYGTLFNYSGYGLKAMNNKLPNTCVPEFLYNYYNNENGENPRKRSKITKEKWFK